MRTMFKDNKTTRLQDNKTANWLALVVLFILSFCSVSAQTIDRQFNDTPLIEARQSVVKEQSEYSVDIMSD